MCTYAVWFLQMNKNVHIEYKCEVDAILSGKEIETANLKETQIKEFDGVCMHA